MTRTSRIGAGVFLAHALVALAARNAQADEAMKTWSELPVVAIPGLPAKKPGWVGAHERTSGMHVVALDGGGGGTRGVQVFASAEEEKAMRAEALGGLEGCFAQPLEHVGTGVWSLGEPLLMTWSSEGDGAQVVRSERLVEDASKEKATLEIVDAWVDARTRGARKIARTTIPLVRVGGVLDDLRVYAAREDGATGRLLHVVVKREQTQTRFAMEGFELESRFGVRGTCGHAHVAIRADAPSGDLAVVRTNVVLPAREKEKAEAKKPIRSEEDIVRAAADAEEPVELRLREVEVQIGASQTTRDKTPLVSVSFGWSGREQQAQGFPAPRFAPKKRFFSRRK